MRNLLQSNGIINQKGQFMIVDLKTKDAADGDTFLIRNGKIVDYQWSDSIPKISTPMLEELYQRYKHSVPNIRNRKRQNSIYFTALDVTELSDADLKANIPRKEAGETLELMVLLAYVRGDIAFDKKSWFWQSKSDPNFIILRKWVP